MPNILSTSDVAKSLGLSRVAVNVLIKKNLIRASRVGVRRWGISEEDLKDFLSSRANKPEMKS